MRQRLQIGTGTASRAARVVLATLLICATLASAVHPDAVFAATHSAMDCCAAMGGAMKDSCPFMRLKAAQERQAAHAAHSDAICHMDRATAANGEASHEHEAPTELYPASTGSVDGIEHATDQSVSSQDTTTHTTGNSVVVAAVSKPCSSDCCCQTNSLTQTQRTRNEAATSNNLRPRPPTSNIDQRTSRVVPKNDPASRRRSPPRAPPASLSNTSA